MGFFARLLGGGFEAHFEKARRAVELAEWGDARIAAEQALDDSDADPVRKGQLSSWLDRARRELARARESEADALHQAGDAELAAEKAELAAELHPDPREQDRLRARADRMRRFADVRSERTERLREDGVADAEAVGVAAEPEQEEASLDPDSDEFQRELPPLEFLLEDSADDDLLFTDLVETASAAGVSFRSGGTVDEARALAWTGAFESGAASREELHDLATALRLYGNDATAAAALEAACEQDPTDAEARIALMGMILTALPKVASPDGHGRQGGGRLGDVRKARNLLAHARRHAKALEASGHRSAAWAAFRAELALAGGDDPAALLPTLEAAWQDEPGHPELAEALARCHLAMRSPEKAAAVLERAAEANPDDPAVLVHWAQVEEALGHADRAKQIYARAQSAGPEGGVRLQLVNRMGIPES